MVVAGRWRRRAYVTSQCDTENMSQVGRTHGSMAEPDTVHTPEKNLLAASHEFRSTASRARVAVPRRGVGVVL